MWEWDGEKLPSEAFKLKTGSSAEEDDNPFLEKPSAPTVKNIPADGDDNPFLDKSARSPSKPSKGRGKATSPAKKVTLASEDPEQTPKPKRNVRAITPTTPTDDGENPFLEKPLSPKKGVKWEEKVTVGDDDNPFVESKSAPAASKDWTRGAMGFIVSRSSHYSKIQGSRVPAYGIGIEVEMDIDKDMGGGMAAVARWTAGAEDRRKAFRQKLLAWVKVSFADCKVNIWYLCIYAYSFTRTQSLSRISPWLLYRPCQSPQSPPP